MQTPDKRIWFGKHVYYCENFAEPTQHPEFNGEYHQTTFTGPDKRTLKLFKRMLKNESIRTFQAEALHFDYRGDLQIRQICNPRVIIVRIWHYHALTPSKE